LGNYELAIQNFEKVDSMKPSWKDETRPYIEEAKKALKK